MMVFLVMKWCLQSRCRDGSSPAVEVTRTAPRLLMR
ncbi:hypothetical protein CLAFUR0_01621, partial [Fulvia fulva]